MKFKVKISFSLFEASVNVKPTVNLKFKVKILFQAHIEEKPKLVTTGVRRT